MGASSGARLLTPLRSLLLGAALSACSGTPSTEACGVAGREQTCPCEGNAIGIQTCQLDGTWEACTCYPLSAGAPAAGASGSVSVSVSVSGSGGAGGGRAVSASAGRFGFPALFAGRTGAGGRRP